jgi:hypothetical protein
VGRLEFCKEPRPVGKPATALGTFAASLRELVHGRGDVLVGILGRDRGLDQSFAELCEGFNQFGSVAVETQVEISVLRRGDLSGDLVLSEFVSIHHVVAGLMAVARRARGRSSPVLHQHAEPPNIRTVCASAVRVGTSSDSLRTGSLRAPDVPRWVHPVAIAGDSSAGRDAVIRYLRASGGLA